MPSVRISPGRLTALWTVIRALEKLGGNAPSAELKRFASRTSLRSGGLPIRDGLTLALEGRFLIERNDTVELGPLGSEALRIETEDEPGDELRRIFLSALLLRQPPAWVAYWQGDPSSLSLVIPEAERRLLKSVGLDHDAASESLEARALWDALSEVPLPQETSELRRVIGDAGESLSVEFERQRLSADGFTELSEQVRWVAQESPAYGFDVLSFRGATFGGHTHDRLAVEVKSIARPAPTMFSFFLTAHEWATASATGDSYIMHFWDGVDPGPPPRAARKEPIVAPGSALADHLPGSTHCDGTCRWESARIAVPVSDLEAA